MQKPRMQKPRKSRLLSSTKGEENRIEFINHVKSKIAEIETAEIEECLYSTTGEKFLKTCIILSQSYKTRSAIKFLLLESKK